jgi:hypothetical protein
LSDDDDDNEDDDVLNGEAPSFQPTAWHGKTMDQIMSSPRGMPVQDSDELQRILRLPRRTPVTEGSATAEALVAMEMAKYAKNVPPGNCPCGCGYACGCHKIDPRIAQINPKTGRTRRRCVHRMKWQQAWALFELRVVGGLVASAPVGLGKTFVDLVAPLALKNCSRTLLMIPSTLRRQIMLEYQLIAEHFYVPTILVHLPGNQRPWRSLQKLRDGSDAPIVDVVPYNFISDQRRSAWIDTLKPDAILCDECDAIADVESSRTMRVLRYYENNAETTRWAGWTGSLTNNQISDFAHLMALALRERSPLPLDREVIDDWSGCLDAVPNPRPAGALKRFLEPHEKPSQVREAFQRRLAETAGVIMIGGRQVIRTDAGDEIENDIRDKSVPPPPERVLKALDLARSSLRPDSMVSDDPDEILNDPLEQARVVRQIALGVFYRWDWQGIDYDLAQRWLAARRNYNSELRYKMLQGEVLLDSAKLCEDAARRFHGDLPRDPDLPMWDSRYWPAWRDIREACDPKTVAEWIDKWLVEDIANWATSNRGIVWYTMSEFADELGRLTGLPVFGDSSEKALERELETRGDRTIICSIKAHGRGRNGLQFLYDTQCVPGSLASARVAQQLFGRLCRDGQQSSVVTTDMCLHTRELRTSFETALRCGEFVQDITTEEQMLLRGWRGYTTQLRDR